MDCQSPAFLKLLRSVKVSKPIVYDTSNNCHCRFDSNYCFCNYNEKYIEVVKGRPEKNDDKCKKMVNSYFDPSYDYYDSIRVEIENTIIKELGGDPIENIKYLEFLLDEIDEDCELYYIIHSITPLHI
jgi:hypothetical protein